MLKSKEDRDLIDEELFEEIEPEEMLKLLEFEQQKLTEKDQDKRKKQKTPFSKLMFGLIALALFLNVIAIFPRTFSIPAIDFLIRSARLFKDENVQNYQEAVVVIETTDGKGTGFGISEDGYIITNQHVVADEDRVTINYPKAGLFLGEVQSIDEAVDLALIKVDGQALPYLELADQAGNDTPLPILFIGNPLRFNGIANEGEWIGLTTRGNLETEIMMLDAPVYRGNSGSPVINQQGEVIGIIYATT